MTTPDLTAIEAAKVVDARAMSCPGPLLEAKKSIAGVKVGEVLEIWSGDAGPKMTCRAGAKKLVMNSGCTARRRL